MAEVVTVERMGFGSAAIAHLESGKTVFVEGGAPGDRALIEVGEQKASFARASLVELVEPGSCRIDRQCLQACGGCPWSHISYEAQLEAKRSHVVEALKRTAHMDAERAEILTAECLPSKRTWGYRNKLELAVGTDRAGRLSLGFHEEGSSRIAYVDNCPLAAKPIAKAPKALRGALRFLQGGQDLGLLRVGVRGSVRTKDVEVALWTAPGAFPRATAAKTLGSALNLTSLVRVVADPGKARKVKKVEVLSGKGCWEEQLGTERFLTSAPSFFQVNTAQAEKLVEAVLEGLALEEGAYVADLYAGGGTFTIPLAKGGADVVAVESAASSVRDLRRNAERAGVEVEVVGGDAARELPLLGDLDALVVDPPRAGLAAGVPESIAQAGPRAVAYVSCDPQTWARDVARLEALGYRLRRAQPVDLFPQTHHVETVGIFDKTL